MTWRPLFTLRCPDGLCAESWQLYVQERVNALRRELRAEGDTVTAVMRYPRGRVVEVQGGRG